MSDETTSPQPDTTVSRAEAERQKWLAERRKGIGGSDAAAILGLSPWKSPLDVYLEKTGQAPEVEENDYMYWGNELEDLIARRYVLESGRKVQRVNRILKSKTHPMIIGNVDRVVCPADGNKRPVVGDEFRTDKILECKSVGEFGPGWGEPGTDSVPDHYLIQCIHYLGITGVESCDLAALFMRERKFLIYTVSAKSDLIAAMFDQLAKWWERHVVAGVPPPPRSIEDVAKLFPRSAKSPIMATEEIESAFRKWRTMSAQIKQAEAEADVYKEKVCVFMGENDTLTDSKGQDLATWKSNKDSVKTDWKAVAAALNPPEELIKRHTVEAPGARVLRSKIKDL